MGWFLIGASFIVGGAILLFGGFELYSMGADWARLPHGPIIFYIPCVLTIGSLLVADAIYLFRLKRRL
jgi:hypothetical protein